MSPREKASDGSPARSSSFVAGTYRPLSQLPDYGESIFPAMWNLDPAPSILKSLYLFLTATSLVCLLFMTPILSKIFPGVDQGWDERNGIDSTANGYLTLPILIEKGLGLSEEAVQYCFLITAGVYLAMVVVDAFLGPGKTTTSPYPNSWNVENTKCYHEMFLEPTRFGRLLRRPGNTLSNAPFLLGSLCIFASLFTPDDNNNIFWWADLLFGVMLFILALSSTLWHGTNSPWTQYPDFWSMDSCILYLIIRLASLGFLAVLTNHVGVSPQTAKLLAGGTCATIYGAIVSFHGRHIWTLYQKRFLHGRCPFSCRARLSGTADLFGSGQQDARISDMAVFTALPFLYMVGPILIQVFLLKASGSLLAGEFCAQTLIVGWTYRSWERFVLDGNVMMNYLLRQKPSLLRTIGCALFSPTGALHFFSGLTLVAGYVHARSLEEQF